MSSGAGSGALRIRLLEPATAALSGGARLLVHGRGFRASPHSLVVRFRLLPPDALPPELKQQLQLQLRADVAGRFVVETQLECAVPPFQLEAARLLAQLARLPPGAAAVLCSPLLLRAQVEVILDSDAVSNALLLTLHQPLVVQKLAPQHVLLAPPTAVTATLNLLRLSSQQTALPQDVSALPVFVRVRQVSERTGALSEQTREGRWKLSPVGVYEVEFDAVTLGFGAASVEVTLNRLEFFRGREKAPESLGYRVARDVGLALVEPCCISVTSGRVTDVRVLGEGFVDSGDLVVQLAQREIGAASASPLLPVAQVNATFVGPSEIRCSVQPNLPFGLTAFRVSLNGGRQFGKAQVVALLHRERALESISPGFGSLEGGAVLALRHACLPVEDTDSPRQLLQLVPPKKVRVRFQALNEDGTASETLVKVVNAEASAADDERGLIRCRAPSFLEETKAAGGGAERRARSDRDGDVVLRVKRFRVSVALGGDTFAGALAFGYYFPPVIRSLSMHHGPAMGGTSVCLRMKFKVPPRLPILVRFTSLSSGVSETVAGVVAATRPVAADTSGLLPGPHSAVGGADAALSADTHLAFLIHCTTPAWTQSPLDLPHLTKVQVSYNGGVEFVPTDDPIVSSLKSPRPAEGAATPRRELCLVKDLSYLYFLFYRPPTLRAIFPMSADIHGGSYLRVLGDHVVDHGAPVSVVFQSPHMSRKVLGFVENGEVRCCAPPFNVGLASVFVSLNAEQYTKCEFVDPETGRAIDFVFYSSPSLSAISPLCACVSAASVVSISGVNLIETGRIKVRFTFASLHGKVASKDTHGRAANGVITTRTPLFAAEYADKYATVDVALNGYDFSGTTVAFYYFSAYTARRAEPATGAFEIPIPLALRVTPQITSDAVQVRVRFRHKLTLAETVFGPVDARAWAANRVEFELPAIATYVESLEVLASAQVDVSFDRSYFHSVGELLELYRVYTIPFLTSMSPLYGPRELPTEVLARGVNLRESDVVKLSLYLDGDLRSPVATVIGRVQQKRQVLTWKCPALDQLVAPDASSVGHRRARPRAHSAAGMLAKHSLTMQISSVDGQQKALPFTFRFYSAPRLLRMSPAVGYVCSGALVSFEFAEAIETPTVDFRFGASQVTAGRVRDGRFVECFSPELAKGVHDVAVSFNEQHFEFAYVETSGAMTELAADAQRDDDNEDDGEQDDDEAEQDDETDDRRVVREAQAPVRAARARATFQAFALPLFALPTNRERVCAFGSVAGGTVVHIKGRGFIAEAKIYVRFVSPFKSGLGEDAAEVVVKARVVDRETIQCVSPPAAKPGRVSLHVSYNLQQFTDSMSFFEFHAPTRYESKGPLCGPVSGGTPVTLVVQDAGGLPEDRSLVACLVRFQSDTRGVHEDVDASFDPDALVVTGVAPPWPSNELVSMHLALSHGGASTQFADSKIKFLFYDPPQGAITIEPSAGPVTGGTEVLAMCGKIVDTGEITVSITMYKGGDDELLRSRPPELPAHEPDDDPVTLLVKGKIVGEAVAFTTPPVDRVCVAYLNISLNGINYTSVHSKSALRFAYYVEPQVRRLSPAWAPLESVDRICVAGEHIRDFGCAVLVRFQLQNPDDKSCVTVKVVGGSFPDARAGDDSASPATAASDPLGVLECSVPALPPGFYEVEVSLNGQQFSRSNYMSAKHGNYSGTACTALLPFRCFATPFFLATPTGPAAGGSTVTLFMAKKLARMLAREPKCQVQFAPIRAADPSAVAAATAKIQQQQQAGPDPIHMVGEVDQAGGRITCRAPLLRSAGAATLDVLLPASQETKAAAASACALFGVKDRERYYSYESPAIAEIAPSCGPTAGGTTLVLEATNLLDTGQIFVRFRSSLNERELLLIPAAFSRAFPDGSLSCSPLIVCRTPPVEIVDKVVAADAGGAGAASTPRHKDALTGRARTQTFQQLADQSVRLQQRQLGSSGANSSRVLRITRTTAKSAAKGGASAAAVDASASVKVLVDFTLNAGEQFIAHSVPFFYYVEPAAGDVAWSPRHLPTRSLDRVPLETRQLSVQLPKSFRLTDAPERICFRFEGLPQPLYWKRRGSSAVLHETGVARELILVDVPKFKTQSTMRRRSTYFRNSSISASSNNVLTSSGGGGNVLPTSVKARPPTPSRGESKASAAAAAASPTPASSLETPFIAGKIVRPNELTCPVPDFSCPGRVRVFLSLNAQQFVCLGELQVHNPVSIKEDDRFRFCSNIGGDPFMLNCSPSTVFGYLLAQCVTNEALYSERMSGLATVKPSRALEPPDARPGRSNEVVVEDAAPQPPRPMLAQAAPRGSTLKSLVASAAWRDREFHVVRVHLVPPLARALRRAVVSVSRVDSQVEIGTSVPDDAGCCVFEMTDWGAEVLLKAAPPPSAGYLPYSAVLREGVAYRLKGGADGLSTSSHVVLVQVTPRPALRVVMLSSKLERARLVAVPSGASTGTLLASVGTAEVVDEGGTDNASLLSLQLVNPEQLRADERAFYVCVELGGAATVATAEDTTQDVDDEAAVGRIQIALCDHVGSRLFLSGVVGERQTGWWVVAHVRFEPESNDAQIAGVDRLVASLEDVAACSDAVTAHEQQPHDDDAVAAAARRPTTTQVDVPPTSRTVAASIGFACADSSRNLSCASAARVVLPGAADLASLLGAPLPLHEVKLECAMPELPFSGPTVLTVSFDGVAFSNSVCVQCYDPRTWRVTALDPPCGLVGRETLLRVEGDNFVENRKLLVRLSDATRYVNARAAVEKVHLLVLRVAAIKNLRAVLQALGLPCFAPPKRDDESSAAPPLLPLVAAAALAANFTLTLRIECGAQTAFATCREASVLAALSSALVLSWEEHYELQVPSKQTRVLLTLELSDASLPKPLEIARAVAALDSLQDGVVVRRSFAFEEHFRKGPLAAGGRSTGGGAAPLSPPSEVDLVLHLSPPMLNANAVVCTLPPLPAPQKLRVQISSGDSFYSTCEEIRDAAAATAARRGLSSWFQVYDAPTVLETTPRVLPRSAGGEIAIRGRGFVESDGGRIVVRVFACAQLVLSGADERQVLAEMNAVARLERRSASFFVRDLDGRFVSSAHVACVVPPHLASFNLYYRLSFDGRAFTDASPAAHVLLFSVDAVVPRGGPVSGNTYTALHGTNLSACLALGGDLTPTVRLTWMRGARELESATVPGESYPSEDVVYFYSPQSKFGLQNIVVNVELSLSTWQELESAALRFGQDEIPFVMYKAPTIKAVAPTLGLVCGLSSLELVVQGLDERAATSLRHVHKARFKRRGQMQVADVQLVGEAKFACLVPRFNVSGAIATTLPPGAVATPLAAAPSPQKSGGGALRAGKAAAGPLKIWNRDAGVYVLLLRARSLHVSKKHTCNPFAVVSCHKVCRKSTRKDGTLAPVWNELFDFEWRDTSAAASPVVRVVVENQLTTDQSEIVGSADVHFAGAEAFAQAFAFRAWFPLRKKLGKAAESSSGGSEQHQQQSSQPSSSPVVGEVELAISYVPAVVSALSKNAAAASKLSSILSVLSSKKQQLQQQQHAKLEDALHRKKEKLLARLFRRHQGPTLTSAVPSELLVELALNGQDFWSAAPHRCYLTPPPIVVNVEPAFVALDGGSQLHVFGMNFPNSGALRVAFAFPSASSSPSSAALDARMAIDASRVVVVDAKYRSASCISCVTPPLQAIAPLGAVDVTLYVATNGVDFESISLPAHHAAVSIETDEEASSGSHNPRRRGEDAAAIVAEKDRYVVHLERLLAPARPKAAGATTSPGSSGRAPPHVVLTRQVQLYLTPTIHGVRPSDGVYTSRLTIVGADFTLTNVAVARFCSTADASDVRTSRVTIRSSERMECELPDFPRGTVVRMSVAVNGVEFFPCPGDLVVSQSPRITELVPRWICVTTDIELTLRGINFTTQSPASSAVQVALTRGKVRRTVQGSCVDGEIRCAVPTELLSHYTSGGAATELQFGSAVETPRAPQRKKEHPVSSVILTPPIMVDVWLGGVHKTFTGMPVPLHIYSAIPTMRALAPMNGPIYGGFAVDVDGSGFINTGAVAVRFELLQGDVGGDAPATHERVVVDARAEFASPERLLCLAPVFPQEGVYMVSVSLNGVEFSKPSASSWFLAWQNWQRRKLLLAAHPLFTRPVGSADATPLLVDDELHVLRRKGSFMLPHSSAGADGGDPRAFGGVRLPLIHKPLARSSALDAVLQLYDATDADGAELADPKLLHWHPASAADEKGRSLLSLLENLCNAPETQPIMCRRIGVVFRLKGTQLRPREVGGGTGDASDASDDSDSDDDCGGGGGARRPLVLRFAGFVEGLRWIFPHALERELEDLWGLVDRRRRGFITFAKLMKRLVREERSRSPDPGPTHYTPQFALVEPKPAAAVILPETLEPELPAGLPSELFMNYDAFKAVRPRAAAAIFPRGRTDASWCNPVAREPLNDVAPDESQDGGAADERHPLAKAEHKPRPPTHQPPHQAGQAPQRPAGERAGGPTRLPPAQPSPRGTLASERASSGAQALASGNNRKESASRSPRGAVRSPQRPSDATSVSSSSSSSAAAANTGRRGSFSTASPPGSRSLFYDDIAPLYLRFLNSKEVQKFMKQ